MDSSIMIEELKTQLLEEKQQKKKQNNKLLKKKEERDIVNFQDEYFYSGVFYCLRLLEKMERKKQEEIVHK